MPHSLPRIPLVWAYHSRAHSATPLQSEGAVSARARIITARWPNAEQWGQQKPRGKRIHQRRSAAAGWKDRFGRPLKQTETFLYSFAKSTLTPSPLLGHWRGWTEKWMAPVSVGRWMQCFGNKWCLKGERRIARAHMELLATRGCLRRGNITQTWEEGWLMTHVSEKEAWGGGGWWRWWWGRCLSPRRMYFCSLCSLFLFHQF